MTITAETIFRIANMIAMLGWILLILLPRWRGTLLVVRNGSLSLALAVTYAILLVLFLFQAEGGFDSLQGVSMLFSNPYVLLAGWIHYLAFDLLIGCWEVHDAQHRGLSHLVIIPSLVCTFLIGPAGYVLYRVTRAVVSGKSVAD